MPNVQPQPVVTPITESAIFLIVTVREGAEGDVRDLLEDVSGLARAVGFRTPGRALECVVGIGSSLWDRLFGGPRPAGLHPFRELAGERHVAVATPGDLLFHLRANRMDPCFELARQLMARLAERADVVDETQGFRYFDERDLLGFVDGTESPTGPAGLTAALIGGEEPDFTGGSYVVVQKYLHDLDAWNAISVAEQERAMGRSKLDDIEIPDEQKASNSHVALNTIVDDDGNERQIVRYNMPFGSPGKGEFGTYFIGYAKSPDVTELMLRNMFIGDPPGNTDRILDFSTAVTGNLFFVPSADMLDDLPPRSRDLPGNPPLESPSNGGLPGKLRDLEGPVMHTMACDGSLRIGSLKEIGA